MWKCSFLAALSLGFIACGQGERLEEQPLGSVQQAVVQAVVQTVGPLKVARTQHCSVKLPDGKVLFVGGYTSSNYAVTATTEVYDPATRTTSLRAPMNVARRGPDCLLLQDGSVLALSGVAADGNFTQAAEKYNPATDTWTSLPQMPQPQDGGVLAQLDDGRVLVAGGYGPMAYSYLFDPIANVWRRMGDMNVGRVRPATIKLPDGRVLAVGGFGLPDNRQTLEVYTPSTGSWSLLASMPRAASDTAAILLPDGRVFVGNDDYNSNLYPQAYDPKTNTWAILPQANSPHSTGTTLGLVNGSPVLVGGRTSRTQTLFERFDVAQQQWSTLGQLSIPRESFTMNVLTDGSLLVAGGVPAFGNQPYDTMDLITLVGGTDPLTYSASNTASATQNTTNRTFTLKAGDTVEVGTCNVPGASASGDTFLRLFGGGTQVAFNDDSCGGGLASYIQYTAPTAGIYELRAGCYSNYGCSGTVTFRITPAKP